jgi:hypothetical protein
LWEEKEIEMTRTLMISAVISGMLAAEISPAADQPDTKAVKTFMRAKLRSAQSVLDGLVTERADLIERGADQMRNMSKAAEWQVIKTPEYLQYSVQFQRNAETLAKAGREKNFDAARIAYVHLTLNCFECHKHVRSVGLAGPVRPYLLAPALARLPGERQ